MAEHTQQAENDHVRAAVDWLRSVTNHLTDEERGAGIALFDAALASQHRAICEYSLIEEKSGLPCAYTGHAFPPAASGGDSDA